MHKSILATLIGLFVFCAAMGQDKGLTKEERKALDSLLDQDEFLQLLKDPNRSYLDINVGMGNGVFSLKNKSLNATQEETNKLFFTPAINYYHKTGLGIGVSGFLASDSGHLKMYRYAINPSYTYDSKRFTAGISYTRFIEGAGTSFEISPFSNDLYASFLYKKTWLQPGLYAGLTTGKIKEYFDSSFLFTPPPPLQPRLIHITDTITTKVQGFSLSALVTHTWEFEKLLFGKDALSLQPTIMLNAGSQHWNISHSNSLSKRRPIVQKALKRIYGDGSGNEKFTLQSVALMADATYFVGKFYIEPQAYFDYYLPSTTGNRFTAVYSLTLGFVFY